MHLQFRGMYFFFMTKTHTKFFFAHCYFSVSSIYITSFFVFFVVKTWMILSSGLRLPWKVLCTISWPIKKCRQNKRYVFDRSLVEWVQGIALSSTFFLPFWQEMMRSWHVCRILSDHIIGILRCLDMFVESNKMVSEF